MRDIFKEFPEVKTLLEQASQEAPGLAKTVQNLVALVSELSYRDGLIDGMKSLMDMMIKDDWPHRLGWAAIVVVSLMAERASSWPYGVIMSVKAIF